MNIVLGLEDLISVGKPQKNCFRFLEVKVMKMKRMKRMKRSSLGGVGK